MGRTARASRFVVGQPEVVSHLVGDGGGQADGVVMVILQNKIKKSLKLSPPPPQVSEPGSHLVDSARVLRTHGELVR